MFLNTDRPTERGVFPPKRSILGFVHNREAIFGVGWKFFFLQLSYAIVSSTKFYLSDSDHQVQILSQPASWRSITDGMSPTRCEEWGGETQWGLGVGSRAWTGDWKCTQFSHGTRTWIAITYLPARLSLSFILWTIANCATILRVARMNFASFFTWIAWQIDTCFHI